MIDRLLIKKGVKKVYLNIVFFLILAAQGCSDNFSSTENQNISLNEDLKNNKIIEGFELYIAETKLDNINTQLAEFFISNLSTSTQTYTFTTNCQLGFILRNRDKMLVDSREKLDCDAKNTSFTLKRGESKKFTIDFDKGTFGSIIPDNSQIKSGLFKLTVFLLDNQSPEISLYFVVE